MSALMTEFVLPFGLFMMMVGMGMSLTLADFGRVMEMPRPILAGLFSMLLLLPGLGFLVANAFQLPPEIAVGIVLVATCPGGMFSNLLTDYGKGNLALSVSLTAVVSAIYVFTAPLWAGLALRQFLGDQTDFSLPFEQTLAPLLLFVLLPIVIGMLLLKKFPAVTARSSSLIKNIAAFLVLLIMVYLATVQDSEAVENLGATIAAVVLLNLTSVLLAVTLIALLRLKKPDALAVIIEHAVRQEGTGIYIAATLVGSTQMALPLMLNSGVGMAIALSALLLAKVLAPKTLLSSETCK